MSGWRLSPDGGTRHGFSDWILLNYTLKLIVIVQYGVTVIRIRPASEPGIEIYDILKGDGKETIRKKCQGLVARYRICSTVRAIQFSVTL